MKTEAEIRKRIADLKTCRNAPCLCGKRGHLQECSQGARMMDAAIDELLWAIDDIGKSQDKDRQVEEMAAAAARIRAGTY